MAQGGFISSSLPIETPASANVVITDVPCDSSVYAGAAVRMTSGGSAVNALADSLTNSNVLGICQEKSSSTSCIIRVLGVTPSIYTGMDVTKNYYLSDSVAGLIQTSAPVASGSVILKVGQPYSSQELLVLVGSRTVRV